jgi:hypothetical protein
MERTESTIVQVGPQYENDKIREMEAFAGIFTVDRKFTRRAMHLDDPATSAPTHTWSK